MKKTFFVTILIMALGSILNAQSFNHNRDKQTYLGPRKEIPENPFPKTFKLSVSPIENNLLVGNLGKFSHELINKSKVFLLPLDGMPCIVPDMLKFNMPVISKRMKISDK